MVVSERTLAERMWFADNRGERPPGFLRSMCGSVAGILLAAELFFMNQFDPPVGLVFCFGIGRVDVGG
jgi:hypothetical protein